jgi:hypothetical protein
MPKFKVGQKVYILGTVFAEEATIKAVLPKRRFFRQRYLVLENVLSNYPKTLSETRLIERQ